MTSDEMPSFSIGDRVIVDHPGRNRHGEEGTVVPSRVTLVRHDDGGIFEYVDDEIMLATLAVPTDTPTGVGPDAPQPTDKWIAAEGLFLCECGHAAKAHDCFDCDCFAFRSARAVPVAEIEPTVLHHDAEDDRVCDHCGSPYCDMNPAQPETEPTSCDDCDQPATYRHTFDNGKSYPICSTHKCSGCVPFAAAEVLPAATEPKMTTVCAIGQHGLCPNRYSSACECECHGRAPAEVPEPLKVGDRVHIRSLNPDMRWTVIPPPEGVIWVIDDKGGRSYWTPDKLRRVASTEPGEQR